MGPLSGRASREQVEGGRQGGGGKPARGGLPASHWGLGALRSLPWPRRTEGTHPRGHRLRAAEDPAGSPAAGPHGESGGHRHGQREEAPFPHLSSQDLQAVSTEDLTSATGSRSPVAPWRVPEGRAGRDHDEGSRCTGRPRAQRGQDTREPREDGKTQGPAGERVSAQNATQGREETRAARAASPVQGSAKPQGRATQAP